MKYTTIEEYFAVAGSRFTQNDARIIGPEIKRLFSDGVTQNHEIVESAKTSASPLHKYFDWDNRVAAYKWRCEVARKMIQDIEIKVISPSGEHDRVRAFHSISTPTENPIRPDRKWATVEQVMETPDMASSVIQQARNELLAWQSKFDKYRKMFPSFAEAYQPIFDFTGSLKGKSVQ